MFLRYYVDYRGMRARLLLAVILLLSTVYAIKVVSPVETEVSEADIIDLGVIGPGQTVSVSVEPKVETGGMHGIGGYYDKTIVSAIPEGWTSGDSKLYGRPMHVTISASPDAREGDYSARITVIDEDNGEELGNVTFIARMQVTWDVLDTTVEPRHLKVGPGQPARYAITIVNKGNAADVFEVSSTGAKRWEFKRGIYVPAMDSRTVFYEIVSEEEERYTPTITVKSVSSDLIKKEEEIAVFVESDLVGDMMATNNGLVVFPVIESMIYGIAGLLSNLF